MNASVGVEVLVHSFLTSLLGGGEWVNLLYRQEDAFPFPRFEPWFLDFPILNMFTVLTALFHLRVLQMYGICLIKMLHVSLSLGAKPDGE
jgi:hypothetical protein